MQLEQQSAAHQSRLELNPTQKQIVAGHAVEAASRVMQIKFSQEQQVNCMLEHAFQSGRRLAYLSLLNYDEDLEKEAMEDMKANQSQNQPQ